MYEMKALKVALSALGLVAAATIAMAQKPAPVTPVNSVLHYESKLGAFKFFNGDGTVTFKFKGTVLIRNFSGKGPTVTGNVKQEYPQPRQEGHGRIGFFGDGTFTFSGHFESLQWFGQELSGTWDGRGGYRIYGDYDKNLETGWFWEGNDVSKKQAWPTQSPTYTLPGYKPQAPQLPTLKKKGS
jgi:hypothetical protein